MHFVIFCKTGAIYNLGTSSALNNENTLNFLIQEFKFKAEVDR